MKTRKDYPQITPITQISFLKIGTTKPLTVNLCNRRNLWMIFFYAL